MGASNFHSRIFVDGYSLRCPLELGTFNFKELKFDAALLVERPDTPRARSTQPRIFGRASRSPSKRRTRPPLCFQRVCPPHPAGRGLVRLLRLWFGAAPPPGDGLVLRLLRPAAGVLHIGGTPLWFQSLGAGDLAGRGL